MTLARHRRISRNEPREPHPSDGVHPEEARAEETAEQSNRKRFGTSELKPQSLASSPA